VRKSLVPLSLVSVALLGGVAPAAVLSTTGTISALDPTKHQVQLSGGQTFEVPAAWDFSKYKVGEKIHVSYQKKNGMMDATRIVAVK
jgi:hypothetical protein